MSSKIKFKELPVDLITVEANVGFNRRADDELVASVKELGVLQPVSVFLRDGVYVMNSGHRRLDACKRAGIEKIPSMVYPADYEAVRLKAIQIAENITRDNLSPVEEFEAYQTLLEVVTDEEAAKLLSKPVEYMENIRAVMKSDTAQSVLGEVRGLDLFQAAKIAELEADPDVPEELVSSALKKLEKAPEKSAHLLAELENDAECEREYLATVKRLEAEGIKVLPTEDLSFYTYSESRNLQGFINIEFLDSNGEPMTPAEHASCGGHLAIVDKPRRAGDSCEIVYGCSDYESWGHEKRAWNAGAQKRDPLAEKIMQAKADDLTAFERAAMVRNTFLKNSLLAREQLPAGYMLAARMGLTSTYTRDDRVLEAFFAGAKFDAFCVSESRAIRLLCGRALFLELDNLMHTFEWSSKERRENAVKLLKWLETAGYVLSDIEKEVVEGRYVTPSERKYPGLES